MTSTITERFLEMVKRPEEDIDLAEAALLIAKSACADLNVERYLQRIDELGLQLRRQLAEETADTQRILALNRFLFEEQGFAPNVENYYDPRNSFLNEVLERKLGIPITLSILYIEVGRRVGLPLQGVSFPGHFLVKCRVSDGVVVLDPYCGGISLSLVDLQKRLREVRGGEVSRAILAGMLVAAGKKEILARVLRNLKTIYFEQEDNEHALPLMEWIVALMPGDAVEVRDRGLLYMRMDCFRAALEDLQRYLELEPLAQDVDEIRAHVIELRKNAARLN